MTMTTIQFGNNRSGGKITGNMGRGGGMELGCDRFSSIGSLFGRGWHVVLDGICCSHILLLSWRRRHRRLLLSWRRRHRRLLLWWRRRSVAVDVPLVLVSLGSTSPRCSLRSVSRRLLACSRLRTVRLVLGPAAPFAT